MSDSIKTIIGWDKGTTLTGEIDLNDVTKPGIYFVGAISSFQNAPANSGYSFLCVLNIGNYICQIIIGGRTDSTASHRIWIRYHQALSSGAEWKPWRYVELNTIQ